MPCMGFLLGYLSGNAFPKPLSESEEQECLAKYAAGDAAARDKLIEHNLRLVAHIAKKFESTGIDKDDLISIGTIGLIKAVNTFDAGKNIRIATMTGTTTNGCSILTRMTAQNTWNTHGVMMTGEICWNRLFITWMEA